MRCLPCASTEPGTIHLAPRLLEQLSDQAQTVQVGVIDGKEKRYIIVARVKGQTYRFSVVELELESPAESGVGVIMESSILEVRFGPVPTASRTISYSGMDALAMDISRFVADSFRRADAYTRLNIPNKKAVILTGVAGSGKKTIIRSCCKAVGLRMFPLSLARTLADREVMESDQAAGLSFIRTVFDMALQSAPSAVILQDLDLIAKDRGVESLLQSSTVSILHNEMNRASSGTDVFVFAVSRDRSKLPGIFQRQDMFQHEFQVPVPVRSQRQDMLTTLLNPFASMDNEPQTSHSMISRAAQISSGYVAKDLRNLCRSALLRSLRRQDIDIVPDKATAQLADRLGSTRMDTILDIPVENPKGELYPSRPRYQGFVEWEDVKYATETSKPSQQIEFESLIQPRRQNAFGGYSSLKKRVYQAIHWPLNNPESFQRMGVKPPMGLLLYGPPAAESNMNFIPIQGPEIFSKYLGETEATLRRLFAMARQIAPCILFFDEMDSIGAKRGWGGDTDSLGSNGVNERVLSTLLNEMDGVEERSGVFVVGCSNQPKAIDDALLRPGRLDQLIYIGYPNLQDRVEIIHTISQRIPLPRNGGVRAKLAQLTVGFSPADLDALFREAAILSLRRDIASAVVDLRDIEQVISAMSPSVQDRIDKHTLLGKDDPSVLIPDPYRQFQQER
ncbi:hypothetical protein EDD11_004843 [Mortierella claussenii]|nr:hypothetical protein EDD11_004843 [Mortierella claussenii]